MPVAMENLLRDGFFSLGRSELFSRQPAFLPSRGFFSAFHQTLSSAAKRSLSVSVLRSSSLPVEIAGEDVMRIFLKERQMNGDLISKVSDMIWKSDNLEFSEQETVMFDKDNQEEDEVFEHEGNNGFLKLTRTREWISGQNDAPINKKVVAKYWQDESEKRKKLNFLKYEALKRELLLLTIGVGAACTAYCLVNLSLQAAFSYASGVAFSCLYLQLLYSHVDNLSKEAVPKIFIQKKLKKIGIRSDDLQNMLEKTLNGSTIALSSPRLVIPVAIYGLWALSEHFPNFYLDFQLVPGMVGFFAYKAAALIQVYRDNKDLGFVFPDNDSLDDS